MKVLKINHRVAELKTNKNSHWVYAGSSQNQIERRIFSPDHHYFRQVLKVLFWGKLIWCGEIEYKNINLFQIPKSQ